MALGAIGVYKFTLKLPGVEVKAEGKKEPAKDEGPDDDSYLGAEEEVWPIPEDPHKSSNKTDTDDGK